MNQEGKSLYPLHLAAKLYKTNPFHICIKVDISVPAENGGPKMNRRFALEFYFIYLFFSVLGFLVRDAER